jgi:hypothetical protein
MREPTSGRRPARHTLSGGEWARFRGASLGGASLAARFFLASVSIVSAAPPPILSLHEISPGARATAKTVLKGTEIESFELEIVSVVRDIGPDQDLILAKAVGESIEHLGVAQGMSGSPVYVDGKIVGALSTTWPFMKEPFFGITPVEQMAREATRSFEVSNPVKSSTSLEVLDFESSPKPSTSNEHAFSPIRTPLVLSGFHSRVVALASELLDPWGFTVTEGGGAGEAQAGGAIEAGATIGVRLAGGDANMTAIGTVTWVDGDRVHAWGHPFFQMGEIDMPLVSGYVHAVVPSSFMSFKFASGAEIVGTATGDRGSGIFGRLGQAPRVTRFDLAVTQHGDSANYRYELVRSRFLTPILVGLTATNTLLVRGGNLSDETVRFRQRIVLDDGRETTIETVMAGEQAIRDTASLLSEATRAIAANPFEEVLIDRIEAELEFAAGIRSAFLTELGIENDSPEPGDTIRGSYKLRDYRGEESRGTFELPLPKDARPGRYLVLVADARTAERYEAERDSRAFAPENLDEYLARLSRIRQTDQLHILLYRSSRGVKIEGRPLADLPPSALSVMGAAVRSGIDEDLPAELVLEKRVPAGKYVQGGHTVLFEVVKEKP